MPEPPTALDHTLQARDALTRRQWELIQTVHAARREMDAIDASVEQLDAVIARLGGDAASRAPKQGGSLQAKDVLVSARLASNAFDATREQSVTTREAIVHMLASANRAFETSEIVERIGEFGAESVPATTRSIVSKMHHAGQLDQVKRGLYRLPPDGSHFARDTMPGRNWLLREPLTPEEFMKAANDPDDGDPTVFDIPVDEPEPERSNAEYPEMAREIEQAHQEDQADNEETAS